MSWLITGGSGQLGLAIQEELKLHQIDFVATNHSELDISNMIQVNRLVKSVKPSVIINSAAWTDVDGAETNKSAAYSVNAIGPKNLAEAASITGSRFVQVSTDYVFSGDTNSFWKETSVCNPQSVYGFTKREGEKFALNTLPNSAYVVRTAWLYSADKKNFAKTMIKLALNTQDQVRVVSDQVGQPTFAGDLAKQIIDLVLARSPLGIYHGTNSGKATWFEFAQEIFKIMGADFSRVVPVSTSEFPRAAKRPTNSILGHASWIKTTIPEMRDWRVALLEAMPAIVSAVKAEG